MFFSARSVADATRVQVPWNVWFVHREDMLDETASFQGCRR